MQSTSATNLACLICFTWFASSIGCDLIRLHALSVLIAHRKISFFYLVNNFLDLSIVLKLDSIMANSLLCLMVLLGIRG